MGRPWHIGDLLDRYRDRIGEPPERTVIEEFSAIEAPARHRYAGEPVEHTELGGRPMDQDPGSRFVKSESRTEPDRVARRT